MNTSLQKTVKTAFTAFKGHPAPWKAKTLKSVDNSIIFFNFLKRGQMINEEYYTSLLHRLR